MERRLFALGLAMGVLVIAVMVWPLWLGRVYIADDLGIGHLAMRAFYARSLARGDSFIWWPDVMCGYYLHGEGQVGMYHPIHLLLYRTLPLASAFTLEVVLPYPLLLAGTFFFLRRLDFRRDAAMFGALVFTFAGFNFLHFVHVNMVAVIAHLPWLLLAIDVLLCDSDARRVAIARLAVALLITSQLLLGHPQAVWLSAVIALLYVVFCLRHWKRVQRVWWLAAAVLCGILGGMVQLLPTWEAASASVRANPAYMASYRAFDSMHPLNLAQLVAPYLTEARVFGRSTQDYALYSGAMASVLFVWLLMRRKQHAAQNALAMGGIVLAAAGFLLAMGKYGYVYQLQAYVPLAQSFGVPVRYILFVHLAFALAAALAYRDLAVIVEQRVALPWRQLWPLTLVLAASLLVAGAAFWLRAQPQLNPDLAAQIASPGRVAVGPALVALATLLVIAAARGSRVALAGIVAFTVLDQAAYGVSFIRRPYPPVAIAAAIAGQAQPPEAVAGRVQSDNSFLTMRGIKLAGGYIAFRPRRELDELNVKRLELAGVQWVQVRAPWTANRETPKLDAALENDIRVTYDGAGGSSTWARVAAPLPRVRLLTREVVTSTPKKDLEGVDILSTAIVSEPLQLAGGEPGTVAIAIDKPGEIQLQTTVPSRQLVVVSESWHPGWRVTVDGRERPLVRVYGDFIGAVVEPRDRAIAFRFRPQSLRVGGWLSVAGLALMLVGLAVSWPRAAVPLH